MNKRALLLILVLSVKYLGFSQGKTDKWLKDLIYKNASPFLKGVLDSSESYQYQLIYTRIDRDKKNNPVFKNYYLNVDRNRYFNPASTVKMPLSFLALEKLHSLQQFGIDINTTMLTDSSYSGQTIVSSDTSSQNGMPSIAQYIRKIFLVSDNDAYNRLYEFLGQQAINETLWKKGYKDVRITRRFVPMNADENRHTNALSFLRENNLLYKQSPLTSSISFDFSRKVLIGNAHYDRNDSLINAPMDFTTHNNVPLEDLQHLLQSVMFPKSVPRSQRFNLTDSDYNFLYQYMSELPRESTFPRYDTCEYFDSYTKFFWFKDGRQKIPTYIRSFNKPGWSYGFLTDVAYIIDFENKTEFMLSGVIYVNRDGVLNDDKYEYEQTGYPFFHEIGKIIYNYELSRKRKNIPNVDRFLLDYQ